MNKFLGAVIVFLFAANAIANEICKIDGTTTTVSLTSKDAGSSFTLTYDDGVSKQEFQNVKLLQSAYDAPDAFNASAAAGSNAGVLSVHVIGTDIWHGYGFYTKISNGIIESFAVTCVGQK